MLKKENSVWLYIYNTLFGISSKSQDLVKYQTNIFDFLDEIETSLLVGFHEDNLGFLVSKKWIKSENIPELIRFREFVYSIPENKWNQEDFDNDQDWGIARKWALSIMSDLGIEKKGWDSTGEKTYFSS